MNSKLFSTTIQYLSLGSKKKDNEYLENFISPMKPQKLSSLRAERFYGKKQYKIGLFPTFTSKGLAISPNYRYKNYTLLNGSYFNKTNFTENKKTRNELPKISLSQDRSKLIRTNVSEDNKYLNSFLYRNIKFSPKKVIKKENLLFMKWKRSELLKIHEELKKKNELYVLTSQQNELNNNINEKEKSNYKSLTEDNKESFEKEYNELCKNKLAEKYLIAKEINKIGKKLSWLKDNKNIKNNDIESDKNSKEDDIEFKDIHNNINKTIFSKRLKAKDPVFEINHISSIPIIGKDIPLTSDLWKKDMKKYISYTLDISKPEDKQFSNELLSVYN
jgi:hypothetical protein